MKQAQKGNAVVTAIMVIAAMAIASGTTYFLATKVATPEQKTTVTSVPTPTPQPSPAPTEQLTESESTIPADWKTYRSEKYGFEFQYPKTITFISENEQKGGNTTDVYLDINVEGGAEWNNEPFALLTVSVLDKDARNRLIQESEFYAQHELIRLNENKAKTIEKNNKVYTLGYGFQDGPSQITGFVLTNDYKKLISTFKFTN